MWLGAAGVVLKQRKGRSQAVEMCTIWERHAEVGKRKRAAGRIKRIGGDDGRSWKVRATNRDAVSLYSRGCCCCLVDAPSILRSGGDPKHGSRDSSVYGRSVVWVLVSL